MWQYDGEAALTGSAPALHFAVPGSLSSGEVHAPQITVLSGTSEQSGYTVMTAAARDFRGWITVNAFAVIRKAARAYRRIVCAAKALVCRRLTLCAGGLRL